MSLITITFLPSKFQYRYPVHRVNNFSNMFIQIIISTLLTFGCIIGQVASYCDYESGYSTDSTSTNYYQYTMGIFKKDAIFGCYAPLKY